jgi:predicted Zn-dependent peptidase
MKYTKKVLPNGLRFISVPMQDSATAIAMVLVEAGSDYETSEINGLSHFLEHMCFKETKNRTGQQIKLELDGLGSESNAFTGEEYTGYYAKTSSKNIEKIYDLISDLYLNSTFPEKDIDIERGVIMEEINMYEDLPQRKVWEVFNELIYPNQSAGRSILGPKENIKKFTQKDFQNYHKKHYIPAKTVFVMAGNFDEKKAIKFVNNTFGKLPKGKVVKKTKAKFSPQNSKVKIHYKETDQTHLVLGFKSFDLYNKNNPTLKLAATILGQGFSSRLFDRMRDQLGMCYYTRAYNDNYTDRGVFLVNSGVGNDRTEEAVRVILEEFKKMRDEEISESELEKAKEFLLGHMACGLETSDAWAMFYGAQELHHEKIESTKDIENKIRAVTSKDIQKIMKQIINKDTLVLALIGPHKDSKKFEKLLTI